MYRGSFATYLATPSDDLLGYADLHAHPAAHLAFGATRDDPGPVWGKPGMAWDAHDSTLASDLPPCDPASHSGFEGLVRGLTRDLVIATIDGQSGLPHFGGGYPDFDGWPDSQSLSHQQMHVSWLHRAWQGGLRLLVASTVDTELIADGWNGSLDGRATHDPKFDFESARRQLRFIQDFALANSDWMEIVRSPEEAKLVVAAGKLAVVLGLEMDSLGPEQIGELACEFPVRHVIPIHLANGPFGGGAVYADAFNTNTKFLTGDYYRVSGDRSVAFRLSPVQERIRPTLSLPLPTAIPRPLYCSLGYECCQLPGEHSPKDCVHDDEAGHKNRLGLAKDGRGEPLLLGLMRHGLIIDVAHMSEKSSAETLDLAEAHHYPVLDSHTDLRTDAEGDSERELLESQAGRIARLGGMLGLGTGPHTNPDPIFDVSGSPAQRFTGAVRERRWSLADQGTPSFDRAASARRLDVTVTTGGDDLRGGSNDNAALRVRLKRGHTRGHRHDVEFELNANPNGREGGQRWENGSTHSTSMLLPAGTTAGDIECVTLLTWFTGGICGDNWDVAGVRVTLPDGTAIVDHHDLARFTGQLHELTLFHAPEPPVSGKTVQYLQMTIVTGDDDLRDDDEAIAMVKLKDEAAIHETTLNRSAITRRGRQAWASGTTHVVRLAALDRPVPVDDIEFVGIRTVQQPSGLEAPDIWDVDEVKVEALSEPVRAWLGAYEDAVRVMDDGHGVHRVAIGTDLNGLAQQIPFGAADLSAGPVDLAARLRVPQAVPLADSVAAKRRFHFASDGIAHVGLVPDFFQAVWTAAGKDAHADAVMAPMFHSAGAFISMWEKVETARRGLAVQGCSPGDDLVDGLCTYACASDRHPAP